MHEERAAEAGTVGTGPLDAVRFAFGTLSVLPVRVRRWDRAAARGGMLAAPLVGLAVGTLAAGCAGLLLALGASPLLAGVAVVAAPAVLTRALHLDGLADTADGLGSGKPPREALQVMKRSDIGPFGVVTLLLVLLAQVASAAACYAHGWRYGAASVVASAVIARTSLTLACRPAVPPARPEGLGAAVAGAVPLRWALTVVAAALCVSAAAGLPPDTPAPLHAVAAALTALLAAEALLHRCRARFGGVTGDAFGALAETATTVCLLALSLG